MGIRDFSHLKFTILILILFFGIDKYFTNRTISRLENKLINKDYILVDSKRAGVIVRPNEVTNEYLTSFCSEIVDKLTTIDSDSIERKLSFIDNHVSNNIKLAYTSYREREILRIRKDNLREFSSILSLDANEQNLSCKATINIDIYSSSLLVGQRIEEIRLETAIILPKDLGWFLEINNFTFKDRPTLI